MFVFIGDISVRLLYQSFINNLHPSDDDNGSLLLEPHEEHKQQQFSSLLTDTNFEETQLNMRAIYIYADQVTDGLLERLATFEASAKQPAVFVVGFTYHNFRLGNVTEELLKAFNANLTRLVAPFDRLVQHKSKVLWKLQDRVNEEKLPDPWKQVRNDDIDRLNEVAKNVFRYSDAIVWKSAWHISNGLVDSAIEGYRVCSLGLKHQVQILLNMYCNDYMNYNDGSCCSSSEPYTNLQIVSYAVFGVW